MEEKKSTKVLITGIGSRSGRPNDHYPNGRVVYLDVSFNTVKEAVEFIELVGGSKVFISNFDQNE